MSFPETPRDIVTELFLNDGWVNVTADVYQRDGITITRGRRDESSKPPPSTCSLTLDNRNGNYSPRNPTGTYYGSVGRNTPIQVSIRTSVDDFSTPHSSGWGTTDTGQAWTIGVGSGGTVQNSDWNVSSGVATHSVPAANAYRLSYLSTTSYRDVDVAVTVSLSVTNITGGAVQPANIVLRGQSTSEYYFVRVSITTAEAITLELVHFDGTVIAGPTTIDGLTHTSSQALRVRAQAEGHTLRAKVWAASSSEPYGWHISAHDDAIPTAGWVGVLSIVATGNTNTKPFAFSYDNWEVRLPRFAGEVASWPQKWDNSGNHVYIEIEAAGITRRLGQGFPLIQSALRRGMLRVLDGTLAPCQYWPCEEEDNATEIATALPSESPMLVLGSGEPDFEANTDFDCSAPLPLPKTTYWLGYAPVHTPNGVDPSQVRFLMSVPSSGITDQTLVAVRTSGSIRTWLLKYVGGTGGSLNLFAYDTTGTQIYDSGVYSFDVDGRPIYLSIEYEQVGSGVEVRWVTVEPGAPTGNTSFLDTISSQTLGITREVQIGSIGDVAIGHVSVHPVKTTMNTLIDQLSAFKGETAGERIERLCAEEVIPFSYVGDLTMTEQMGAQLPGRITDLLDQCAAVDFGTLYESRGEHGIAYRTRESLYNQPAALTLDYSAGQLAHPFEPVDDDQLTRNDITVQRTGGSSGRAVLETGRMSILQPEDGGVGRYDDSLTLNAYEDDQLPHLAGWLLNLGTVDETRYPVVKVNLANPTVVAAELESAVLDLDIDDRITISNPKAGQTPDEISQIVRGYTEFLNAFEHNFTFNCAPESPYQVLELDDTEARLDSDASTLNSGVSSSATSLSVAVSDGVLWTTNAGQMPIPIDIGGEEMSVTAISGASSPQTFTVTRSVNGVVKSHSAGAEVRLHQRATIAL